MTQPEKLPDSDLLTPELIEQARAVIYDRTNGTAAAVDIDAPLTETAKRYVGDALHSGNVPGLEGASLLRAQIFAVSLVDYHLANVKRRQTPALAVQKHAATQLYLLGVPNSQIATKLRYTSESYVYATRKNILNQIRTMPDSGDTARALWEAAAGLRVVPTTGLPAAVKPGAQKRPAEVAEPTPRLDWREAVEPQDSKRVPELERIIAIPGKLWSPEDLASLHDYVYGANGSRLDRFRLHLRALLVRQQPFEPATGTSSTLRAAEWQTLRRAAGYGPGNFEPHNINQLTAYVATSIYKAGREDSWTLPLFADGLRKLIQAAQRDYRTGWDPVEDKLP